MKIRRKLRSDDPDFHSSLLAHKLPDFTAGLSDRRVNCLPLILDLRCSRRLMQQAPFVLDNVRTKTKRIAVHSGELCETLCCKLSRDDIDQELPVGRYFREPKDQVGGILGNILTN